MTSLTLLGRSGLLLALALPLTSCDLVFGSRPIGGGEWQGTMAKVQGPADEVFAAVTELLGELDAGKAKPYPEDAKTSVRVTWDGAWAKVAVDPARPFDCVVSAFTMGERGGDELLHALLAGLIARGYTVETNPEGAASHIDVPGDAFQAVGNAYRMPGWETFHEQLYGSHGGDHGDDHGHSHDDGHGHDGDGHDGDAGHDDGHDDHGDHDDDGGH